MSSFASADAVQLAQALLAGGHSDQAARVLHRAAAQDPTNPEIFINLARLLTVLGRQEEALIHARRAVELNPTAAAFSLLGTIIFSLNPADASGDPARVAEAIRCYHKAIALDADCPEAHYNLGLALQRQLRPDEAESCYRRAIELRPDYALAHNNLAALLTGPWRLDEAMRHLRRALAIRHDFAQAHSNLLLDMHYAAKHDPRMIFAEHLRWAELHGLEAMKTIKPHANERNPHRRLRIGYLSPDFRQHSVSFFFEPILASHDRNRFEVFCYSAVLRPDGVTRRLRAMSDHWREITGRPDDQAAEMVRADGIDILIDLAGHTADNRLRVLASKPAPVQMTYLGYPDTTGLSTVDYRITDAPCDPPGTTEAYHTEELLRLEGCFLCYRPGEDAPCVSQPPATQRGHVTFGCFNNISKMTPAMLQLSAQLLRAAPGSKLLLKDKGFASPRMRQPLLATFAQEGIEVQRIALLTYESSRQKHMGLYARVDVALDTSPYCGTTTTCEAMWMGVPVVTLAGRTHASRVGCSLLSAVGMAELVAHNDEEYVELARRLANDMDKLAAFRASLRRRMKQSFLTDASRFTHELERAYRAAWARWCARL